MASKLTKEAARLARDHCIAMASHADAALALLRPGADAEQLKDVRRDLASAAGEASAVIKWLVQHYPELDPTEKEWHAIADTSLGVVRKK